MAEPFLSEIRIMSFGFAPRGWALCDGQTLPINQNQALFSLLGTTFGGNGQTTFGLPRMQGRTPIHVGSGFIVGQQGGEQSHTLSSAEMPMHLHLAQATSIEGTDAIPSAARLLANSKNYEAYRPASNLVNLNPATVTSVGGNQAHLNMQPFLTLSFCIALQGIFPSPN